MKKQNGKIPSQRQLQVGEMVRHELTLLLQRGSFTDSLIKKTIFSISEVSMSADLKKATIWISAFETEDAASIIAILNAKAKTIRGRLSPALRRMKYMPSIYFQLDTGAENYEKISQLLKTRNVSGDMDQDCSLRKYQ